MSLSADQFPFCVVKKADVDPATPIDLLPSGIDFISRGYWLGQSGTYDINLSYSTSNASGTTTDDGTIVGTGTFQMYGDFPTPPIPKARACGGFDGAWLTSSDVTVSGTFISPAGTVPYSFPGQQPNLEWLARFATLSATDGYAASDPTDPLLFYSYLAFNMAAGRFSSITVQAGTIPNLSVDSGVKLSFAVGSYPASQIPIYIASGLGPGSSQSMAGTMTMALTTFYTP